MKSQSATSSITIAAPVVDLFLGYGERDSRLTLSVSNSASQSVTIVGCGWSYSDRDDSDSAISLDTLFSQPIPIPPLGSGSVIIPISSEEEFTAEPRAKGRIRLFSDREEDFADCTVTVKFLPSIEFQPRKFVARVPGILNMTVVISSENDLPDLRSIRSKRCSWEAKRTGPSRFELIGKFKTPPQFLRGDVDDEIEISFSGIEHTLVRTIRIELNRCAEPDMKFIGDQSIEVNSGRERIFFVSISNIGAEELRIDAVTPISVEGVRVVLPDHGLAGLRLSSLGSISFPVLVAMDSEVPSGGMLDVGVRVASNSESKPAAELRASAVAAKYRTCATPIAFDFGTVNSCAAYVDETLGIAELLPVPIETEPDRFISREIFPSVMRVESIVDEEGRSGPGICLITRRKDTFNILEAKSAFCRAQPIPLRYSDGVERQLDAGACITRFFGCVLSHAEHQLAKTFRDCVITVPTKYGGRTVENMRLALQRVGFPTDRVHVYDESTSAAMFYVRQGRDSDFLHDFNLPEAYSLVIIDVGGGTTDVSILDVLDCDSGDRRQLEVVLRGTTGRIRFGGTHFNRRVKENWFRDYSDACAVQELPLKPVDELEPEQQQQLLIPEGRLGDAIEEAKCALGTTPARSYNNIESALESYTFLASDPAFERAIDVSAFPKDLTFLTHERLSNLLGKDLADISAEVQLMARSLARHPLGVVLLVGQSSQLEAIRQTITGVFGEDKVCLVPAETAKSCVVRGALELHQLLRNPGGIDFAFRDLSKVLSCRIGMLWSGRYEMEFKELLPIGSELPAESITDLPHRGNDTLRITFLANYGAKDKIQGNENIVRLGTYTVGSNFSLDEKLMLKLTVKENGDIQASLISHGQEMELTRDE